MNELLQTAELFATNKIVHDFSDRLVYHDIDYQHRVLNAIDEIGKAEGVTEDEMSLLKMAGWFINLGFDDLDHFPELDEPDELFENVNKRTLNIVEEFFSQNQSPNDVKQKVIDIINSGKANGSLDSKLGKILADAVTIDFAKPKANKRMKLMYEEFLLTEALSVGKREWYENVIEYLKKHRYQTDYGKQALEPVKDELILKLSKEKKNLQRSKDSLITKELEISESELKKLKKSLVTIRGRDDRGIQTLFRTTSKNHYTLNEMVDRKANIMISINAILISLIMGRIIGQEEVFCIHNSPILLMLLFSLGSILYAVAAIRPAKTHGHFTEEDVRESKGNLLYFGNYHDMSFREYQWGMLEMLNNGDHLYTTLIRDIYYLGQTLNRKYKFIRKSLGLFMVGFALSVILFLFVAPFYGVHF